MDAGVENGTNFCINCVSTINVNFKPLNYFVLWSTVDPRFNEVPRDWGNCFVISRFYNYIENLDITSLWKNNQNIRYIEV